MIEKIKTEFYKLNRFNKVFLILTITLLIYGYLCRILNAYFFWESKTIAWFLLLILIISILLQKVNEKKLHNKKNLTEKIFLGFTVFIILMQTIIFIGFSKSDANKTANKYIKTDKALINEIGNISEILLIPTGSISISSSSEGEMGAAELNYIVKGTKKFVDVNLLLEKENNTNWQIINKN